MIAFSIGSMHIYRYGIFYLTTFVVGYFLIKYLAKQRVFLRHPNFQKFIESKVDDVVIYVVLGVLIGGRLGEILIYNPLYYIKHPLDMLAVRNGGMSFIGGMIGVVVSISILIWQNRLKKSDFLLMFDMVLSIVPFGIMIGRIGNFLNQELYGLPVSIYHFPSRFVYISNKIHLFHVYEKVDNLVRLNTNFISSFTEGFLLLIITWYMTYQRIKTKQYRPGNIGGVFLLRYSFIRFLLEYLRVDSQSEFIGSFTRSQRFFIGFFLLGLIILGGNSLFKKRYFSNL